MLTVVTSEHVTTHQLSVNKEGNKARRQLLCGAAWRDRRREKWERLVHTETWKRKGDERRKERMEGGDAVTHSTGGRKGIQRKFKTITRDMMA